MELRQVQSVSLGVSEMQNLSPNGSEVRVVSLPKAPAIVNSSNEEADALQAAAKLLLKKGDYERRCGRVLSADRVLVGIRLVLSQETHLTHSFSVEPILVKPGPLLGNSRTESLPPRKSPDRVT